MAKQMIKARHNKSQSVFFARLNGDGTVTVCGVANGTMSVKAFVGKYTKIANVGEAA